MQEYNDTADIQTLLTGLKNVVITTHSNPDGDALGSSLALAALLRQIGKDVKVLVPNDYPSFLAWMPGISEVIIYKRNVKVCRQAAKEADLIFCLDYNCLARTEKMQEIFALSTAKKVLIDHHLQPATEEFDLMISKIDTTSTSELVYVFMEAMGYKDLITKEMAELIYVGLITDTGSFSYACNYERVYHITAELIKIGVDGEKVHRLVYDTYSENRMRLLGYCLSERLTVLNKYGTAYIVLSKEDLKRFQYQIGDTEGVVNYALSINGVSMAVLFTEKDNLIRMSFRSKGNFSVNEFVRKHFDGGGHRNAAGGNSYLGLEETVKKFESLLPEFCESIKNSSYD